jgi:hypothetical protein
VVHDAKVRDYLLSPTHPVGRFKAAFFAVLGYTAANWSEFRDVLTQLARTEDAHLGDASQFGQKYELHATITGPAGRSADIVTVWIVLNDEDYPRFVTAYPA